MPSAEDAESRLRSLIREAELARAEALAALKRADAALAAAQRALESRPAPPGMPVQTAAAPVARHRCDDALGNPSTADWVIRPVKREMDSAGERVSGLNEYTGECLGLTKAKQYKNTTDLGLQLTGNKGDGVLDVTLARTIRRFGLAEQGATPDQDTFRSSYWKFTLGGFGAAGSSGDASLFNLTDFEFDSGVGFQLGVEWGRSATKTRAELGKTLYDGIAKARRECVAFYGIHDPMLNQADKPDAQVREVVRNPDPIAKCEGAALVDWMKDASRSSDYWAETVAPFWGYKQDAETFGGMVFRYGFTDFTYLPIKDPATGTVVVSSIPDKVELHAEPYSLKAYAGFVDPIEWRWLKGGKWGLTGSLTWRREYSFVKATQDQEVCYPRTPGATFDLCDKVNIAAPYELEGLVLGGSLNFQLPRMWYLPPFAASIRPSYALDTNRWGIEAPFFLLTDAEGKLNSGLKFVCRFKGRTPQGLELEEECGISAFIGTKFDLTK
ncbi:hypothetical protein [Sphingomonas plantiphila]|uniref:hypothetical protein n=1 Tax=Sphingomonas plantiphila TaxID=3163295 RepID=UPI0038B426EB